MSMHTRASTICQSDHPHLVSYDSQIVSCRKTFASVWVLSHIFLLDKDKPTARNVETEKLIEVLPKDLTPVSPRQAVHTATISRAPVPVRQLPKQTLMGTPSSTSVVPHTNYRHLSYPGVIAQQNRTMIFNTRGLQPMTYPVYPYMYNPCMYNQTPLATPQNVLGPRFATQRQPYPWQHQQMFPFNGNAMWY